MMPFILCEPVEPVNVYITLFSLFHFLARLLRIQLIRLVPGSECKFSLTKPHHEVQYCT
jgi:hypothetical protein